MPWKSNKPSQINNFNLKSVNTYLLYSYNFLFDHEGRTLSTSCQDCNYTFMFLNYLNTFSLELNTHSGNPADIDHEAADMPSHEIEDSCKVKLLWSFSRFLRETNLRKKENRRRKRMKNGHRSIFQYMRGWRGEKLLDDLMGVLILAQLCALRQSPDLLELRALESEDSIVFIVWWPFTITLFQKPRNPYSATI